MSDFSSTEALQVQHDLAQQRFIAVVDGHRCVADYRMAGKVMQMVHTAVHPSLRGRGIAAALVGTALQYAREGGLQVDPICSYVRVYINRHPETRDLLG
ncbi:GNAT family N-acetyltransferase [Piscinibacter sakaiensis]|uniref:GNAT family N-acetyltransferase n=1 Tax=Piscinibacter sakaiensis TaxID=1547922 RepID=UPI003AB01572